MPYIIMKFGPSNEREVEAFGFRGDGNLKEADCRKATEFLEEALGTVTDVKAKVDWAIRNGDRVRETKRTFEVDTTKHCG
jgi:hypothetical protein